MKGLKLKEYGLFGFILCFFLIFEVGCKRNAVSSGKSSSDTYLVEFLSKYEILPDDTIFLLQPAKCLSCQPSILLAIDSVKSAAIFVARNDSCIARFSTQRCIYYDKTDFSQKGLAKFYSEMLVVNQGNIVARIPLFR